MFIGVVRLLVAVTLLHGAHCSLPSLFGKYSGKLSVDLIKSSALSFTPWVKLHHIVVLKDIAEGQSGAYTMDYSPINQRKVSTLVQLFFGRNVPAEIRIRFLNSTAIDLDDVKNRCECSDIVIIDKQRINVTPYRGILSGIPKFSPAMEELLDEVIKRWQSRMNLYTHNCQHFSGFIRRLIKRS